MKRRKSKQLRRTVVCILLPPLAVVDRGLGTVLVVAVFTLLGWAPGVLAALMICAKRR